MLFSKSFGYALRAILFMSEHRQPGHYVKVDLIASQLDIPRHFLSKVLKSLSKKNILLSSKGPTGGFAVKEDTLNMSLTDIAVITRDMPELNRCMLTFRQCNLAEPCALHTKLEALNREILNFLNGTTIADLRKKDMKGTGVILPALLSAPLSEPSAA